MNERSSIVDQLGEFLEGIKTLAEKHEIKIESISAKLLGPMTGEVESVTVELREFPWHNISSAGTAPESAKSNPIESHE